MLIHGFHAVMARLRRAPESVETLYLTQTREDPRARELIRLAEAQGVRPHFIDQARMQRICPHKRHQGVAAMVSLALPSVDLEDLLDEIEGPPLLLLLDGVTDPRNLGACLRVAEGAGAHAVVAPKDHASNLTEVAIQTASGAAESIPYVMVTNLARTMDLLTDREITLIGTADEAEATLYEQAVPPAVAWVLGAEGKGLRRLTRERCDHLVRIPMQGQVSSLNVSVAAGVVLYETLRQTRS